MLRSLSATSRALGPVAAPLGLTFTHQMIGSFFLMGVPVLAPVLAERAALPSNLIGLYISLAYIMAMATSGLSGHAFARFGAMTTSTLCMGSGLVAVALLLGTSPVILAASAVLMGVCYGPLTPASSHVLSAHTPLGWKNTVFALKQTGVSAGGGLAGLILPGLVLTTGFAGALLVPWLAALSVVVGLTPLARRLDRTTAPPAPPASQGGSAIAVKRTWLWSIGSGSFCYAGVQITLTTFLGLYVVEYIGLSLAAAGALVGLFHISGLGSRLVWGALADRIGERVPLFPLIGFLSMLSILLTLTVGRPDVPWSVLVGLFLLLGITSNSWTGLYFGEIARVVPMEQVGRVTGVALMFTFAGVVVTPPAFGTILSFAGYPAAFVLVAMLGAAGGLAGLAARRYATTS